MEMRTAYDLVPGEHDVELKTTLTEDFVIGGSSQSTANSGANESMLFGRFEGALDQFNQTVERYLHKETTA
ncbi:MAG: hypothetical protein AAF529_10435 [Pseudomonadota bacterium]